MKLYREKIERIYKDTMFDSFFHRMVKHPDFLDLVEIGVEIIPLIIEDLEGEEPSWVHIQLLYYINQNKNLDYSNIEPGKFLSCRDFWLKWWQKEQRENKLNRIIKDT